MRNITVSLRLDQVKIVVTGDAAPSEPIPQVNGSYGSSYLSGNYVSPDVKGMKSIRYNVCNMESSSRES